MLGALSMFFSISGDYLTIWFTVSWFLRGGGEMPSKSKKCPFQQHMACWVSILWFMGWWIHFRSDLTIASLSLSFYLSSYLSPFRWHWAQLVFGVAEFPTPNMPYDVELDIYLSIGGIFAPPPWEMILGLMESSNKPQKLIQRLKNPYFEHPTRHIMLN